MSVFVTTDKPEESTGQDTALLERIRNRKKICVEAETDIKLQALDDKKFASGESQWDDQVRRDRELSRRPCLTINQMPQYVQQIVNDFRQSRPQLKVSPVDDGGDKDTAKVLNGVIRHIEANSGAEIAYDTALESAVDSGFGYFRIVTAYSSDDSFEQEILIKRIVNPSSVSVDPAAVEPDYSDARFMFIDDWMTRDEYEAAYPGSELTSRMSDISIGNQMPDWITQKGVLVSEYFEIEEVAVTMAQMPDGSVSELYSIPEEFRSLAKTRAIKRKKVVWYKTNGYEILAKQDWPGKYIPIIPVLGIERFIDGKRILEGIVRHAKDPARMYNYWATAETEMIALAPKAPFIGAEGQFEGHEHQWRSANNNNIAFLEYKPVTLNNTIVPPPQRNGYTPPIAAVSQARAQSRDDLKAVTGIYDASLGARSNETSGRAINARQQQGQIANFHFIDNFGRSLRHAGRVLVDLIPKIYDTPRVLRIIGEDGQTDVVKVNQRIQDKGVERIYDLTTGRYDVTVTIGPAYATRRQEAAQTMMQMIQANPALMQIAGDLVVKSMDWPGADALAERLKKTLPPQLQDKTEGSEQQVPPQVAAQLAQCQEMVQKLTEALNKAQDQIENKELELESRERIALMQARTSLAIELAKIDQKDSLAIFTAQVAEIDRRMGLLNNSSPVETNDGDADNSAGVVAGGVGMGAPLNAPANAGIPA